MGYVSAKDIVSLAWDGGPVVLADLLRNVKFFPETVPAIEVLRYMQRERQRIAIAVDEHGVVSGMVTFEDLVEELIGDIFSEHDEDLPALTREPDGTALVRGDTPIRDVNRALEIELDEPAGVTTISGLCPRRWRAESPTATRVWRPATGPCWSCSRRRRGRSNGCGSFP